MKNKDTTYKKLTFQTDAATAKEIEETASKQYLSTSAFIRKCLDKELNKENHNND